MSIILDYFKNKGKVSNLSDLSEKIHVLLFCKYFIL